MSINHQTKDIKSQVIAASVTLCTVSTASQLTPSSGLNFKPYPHGEGISENVTLSVRFGLLYPRNE